MDDAFWLSLSAIERKANLLYGTIKQSRYLSWWKLSGKCPCVMECLNIYQTYCMQDQFTEVGRFKA